MKQETLFLKVVIFLMAVPVIGLCIFVVPMLSGYAGELLTGLSFLQYLFAIALYATAIAYFAALYQALKLLSYIDKNEAFSEQSVKALRKIKQCAITIGGLYVVCMPIIMLMAQADDAPGLTALGVIITCGAFVIAVFAAVLQKLLKNAMELKSENDLTV